MGVSLDLGATLDESIDRVSTLLKHCYISSLSTFYNTDHEVDVVGIGSKVLLCEGQGFIVEIVFRG